MSKYIDLADRIIERLDMQPGVGTMRFGAIEALAYLDRYPDEQPGRTITRSKLNDAREVFRDLPHPPNALRAEAFLGRAAGITVVPEPTNAEKLRDLFDGHIQVGQFKTEHLATYLDLQGVTAPGGDGD